MDLNAASLTCLCGYENFERVVVQRKAGPIVTDFLACVGCKAMYHWPSPPETEPREPSPEPPARTPVEELLPPQAPRQRYAFPALESNVPVGWVDPADDSAKRLKDDAKAAAEAYRKPGRSGRLGPGGRR